jgi:hypothetical protein
VEIGLAGDRGHAHAVAVAGDARDHAFDQALGLRMAGVAEAQGVQQSDRPRAHREDVAHDAAHARRRALVGLDVGRVVVALHLEDDCLAVVDVDDAGVLARPADDARPVIGNFFNWFFEDLYEQCSDHITEKTPSSTRLGSRPSRFRTTSYSAGFRPNSAANSAMGFWGVLMGAPSTPDVQIPPQLA